MQTAEHMVRGVAYHSCDWALQPVIGWSMLTAGSLAKERKIFARAVLSSHQGSFEYAYRGRTQSKPLPLALRSCAWLSDAVDFTALFWVWPLSRKFADPAPVKPPPL